MRKLPGESHLFRILWAFDPLLHSPLLLVGRPKTALRWFTLSAAGILIGTAIGSLAGIVIVHGRFPLEMMAQKRGFIIQSLVICSTAGAILTYVFYSKTRIRSAMRSFRRKGSSAWRAKRRSSRPI